MSVDSTSSSRNPRREFFGCLDAGTYSSHLAEYREVTTLLRSLAQRTNGDLLPPLSSAMGGTASRPTYFDEPRSGGRLEVVQGRKEILRYVSGSEAIRLGVCKDELRRSRVTKQVGSKSHRTSSKSWEEDISRRMANGFASSGDTLVAGYDEDGWFVTALVGHWNKSAASLHVAASVHSQAEIGTPGVSDCYLKLMQRAGGLGKRKMVTDPPASDVHFYEDELGFKRQKTQNNVEPGRVRLVHNRLAELRRQYLWPYVRDITRLAKLVQGGRAIALLGQTTETRLVTLPLPLIQAVLRFL